VSAGASRRINRATRTPSKWPVNGVPLIVIQRQLGHTNLGITSQDGTAPVDPVRTGVPGRSACGGVASS
jgi:hypothetical protein